jgi:hypothetical protein
VVIAFLSMECCPKQQRPSAEVPSGRVAALYALAKAGYGLDEQIVVRARKPHMRITEKNEWTLGRALETWRARAAPNRDGSLPEPVELSPSDD